MANVLSLNTTDHPNLVQVLVNTPTGLFDFKGQQVSGSVTIAAPAAKSVILAVKNPTTGKSYIKET